MKDIIKILAIETSCDETAAAVIFGKITSTKSEILNSKQRESNSNHQKSKYVSNFDTRDSDFPIVLSNIVSSQVDLHAKTGGVVPEVASRAHMEAIIPVIEEALKEANSKSLPCRQAGEFLISKQTESNSKAPNSKVSDFDIRASDLLPDITHIAVTAGPGLIGSLLVGFNTAKAIAYSRNLPLIPINHIEGHIYSAIPARVKSQKSVKSKVRGVEFPILALTVSGGHTSLTLVENHLKYKTLGETLDDAAGEAFDKVAKLLELGYPGGPIVSKFAEEFRNRIVNSELRMMDKSCNSEFRIHNSNIQFPRPLIDKPNFDFSFSGLKTAVLTYVKKLTAKNSKPPEGGSPSGRLTASDKEEICFAFEEAAVDVLVTKTMRAVREFQPKGIILAGGVAANKRLRDELAHRLKLEVRSTKFEKGIRLLMPPPQLCGDNAAMIGLAAYYHIIAGESGDWCKARVDSNIQL